MFFDRNRNVFAGPKGNITSGAATATPQGGVYGVTGSVTGPRGRTTSRSGTVNIQSLGQGFEQPQQQGCPRHQG